MFCISFASFDTSGRPARVAPCKGVMLNFQKSVISTRANADFGVCLVFEKFSLFHFSPFFPTWSKMQWKIQRVAVIEMSGVREFCEFWEPDPVRRTNNIIILFYMYKSIASRLLHGNCWALYHTDLQTKTIFYAIAYLHSEVQTHARMYGRVGVQEISSAIIIGFYRTGPATTYLEWLASNLSISYA